MAGATDGEWSLYWTSRGRPVSARLVPVLAGWGDLDQREEAADIGPGHPILIDPQHLEEAQRDLRQVRDQAQAGGDWHRQLEAALAHLSEMDRPLLDAEQRMPEDSSSATRPSSWRRGQNPTPRGEPSKERAMPKRLEPEEGERLAGGPRWVQGSLPEDYEPPDVLVSVTARESDALEHVHMLLCGQRRHKLPDAIGELLLRIRERQDIPVEIHEGIPEKTPSDPEEELRPGPCEEDWERW